MTHSEREAVEKAYGLLWRYLGRNRLVHEARGRLLPIIGQEGQERGIAYVTEKYGPVTDNEMLTSAAEDTPAGAEPASRRGK